MAKAPTWKTGSASMAAIIFGSHGDPFSVLGLHKAGKQWIARAFVPGADSIEVQSLNGEALGALVKCHEDGFFEGPVNARHNNPCALPAPMRVAAGPSPTLIPLALCLGPMDDYYIGEGNHLRLYDKLGAHAMHHEGADGVHFALWAPNAKRVSIIGDFNNWDGRLHVMRLRLNTGIWEIFVPGAHIGQTYKFEIIGQHGNRLPLKADPFAFNPNFARPLHHASPTPI